MSCKCVKVLPVDGESTRVALDSLGILNHEYKILSHEGHLYIPIAEDGTPPSEMNIVYMDLPPNKTRLLPSDLLPFKITYERLGDIILLDEPDAHQATAATIALLASDIQFKTILNKASEIQGDTRVRKWSLLSGNSTETIHKEYGFEFLVDISKVYFSPRLSTERKRVADQVCSGENVFDMFSGIGPFTVPIASKGAIVNATDINDLAIDYLRKNISRNNVEQNVTAHTGDVRNIADDYSNWADRIIMNLPHSANDFLDVAFNIAGKKCILHYYSISELDDPFTADISVLQNVSQEHEVTILNETIIRSYSPSQVHICIDALLTR
ncbi:MAG: class I SAM-dependent methyltransferase [Halobacteriales archaeon]